MTATASVLQQLLDEIRGLRADFRAHLAAHEQRPVTLEDFGEFLSLDELARLTGYSRRTFQRLAALERECPSPRLLPPSPPGRRLRFRKRDVRDWLDETLPTIDLLKPNGQALRLTG